MKYLNFIIIFLMFLSSCVLSGKPEMQHELNSNENTMQNSGYYHTQLGDSITVDTVIGDFKVFYRISEVVDTNLVASSCDEDTSIREVYKIDKTILLNIQKVDTTSIVAYKTITISDFDSVIPKAKDQGYLIDSFYLKEVAQNSVIFGAKLCMFDKNLCTDIDVFIDKNGVVSYMLLK